MGSMRQQVADVVVVDYGLGNLRSAVRGLERAGADVSITADSTAIHQADGVVLPGVGAFSEGMENAEPLREELQQVAASDTPLFGVCLGMQMLLTESEEAEHAGQGDARGLDLIPGRNVRLRRKKVPHMGWNSLELEREHPIVEGVDGEYMYFVHSYYAQPAADRSVVASTEYGVRFPSVIADESGTVFGTQFHPEKSGDAGLTILRNFVDFCASRG